MVMLKIAFITREEGLKNDKIGGYWIEEVDGEVLYSLKCGS
jgi:phenylalanyl-tRNA synthetase beta chain